MKNLKLKYLLLSVSFIFLFACSDKDRNNLTNPVSYMSNYGPSWDIFKAGLNVVGCEVKYYVDNNYSTVTINKENIAVHWDGSIGVSYETGARVCFYGFEFDFDSIKNLTQPDYNKIKIGLKGDIANSELEIAGFSDVDKIILKNNQLDSVNYKEYIIPISASLSNVKKIIGFVIKSTGRDDINADPANIYINYIKLIKE